MRRLSLWTTTFSSFYLAATAVWAAESSEQFFRDQVAPLLQHRCLSCHNEDRREGAFSVQTRDSAFSGGYIEAGDADLSYLLDVVTPSNGIAEMPKNGAPLAAEEIATLREWINAGATWPADQKLDEPAVTDFGWWSYQPVSRPPVPSIVDPWIRTPIDAFVLAKLKKKGLTPSPEADRRTLIRRLTFDLVGLPPTPEEVDSFVNDPEPEAYEQLVEKLLASPHYGERWARHWLDVVKYADTCGYDKDKLRPNAWPYRDYVVRSFNDDKPYSQFVREQIAGDALFPDDPDGIVGLGFIAAGPWDFIGHVEVSEDKIDGKIARDLDRDDMVSNALNAFCSATVQCARCHNHTFDPITQEHYYGLQAIFAAVDRADRPYDSDPEVTAQRVRLTLQHRSLQEELDACDQELATAAGPRLKELDERIATLRRRQKVATDPQFGYHSAIANSADDEKWVEIDLGKPVAATEIVLHPCYDNFADIGAGFGFPVRFRVDMIDGGGVHSNLLDQTAADFPNPGIDAVTIDVGEAPIRRVRITATKLAERRDDFIFALAEVEVLDREGNNRALGTAVTSLDSIEAAPRWARQNLTDGRWARVDDPTVADQLAAAVKERQELLARSESPQRAARREELQQSLGRVKRELDSLPAPHLVYAAATHFEPEGSFQPTEGKPRPIHILSRGDVQQPREEAVPSVLPLSENDDWQLPPAATEADRRAALARWLTRDDHPLVWRSIVNRVWQHHFGNGIVTTPNDFGKMGAEPTHPELLDWLASEFQARGESFKELHRLIVTSSVYRQSSHGSDSHAEIDGENQYLWRMQRRRLDAEEIRDAMLTVSGLLDTRQGGPGFYLFDLEKEEHSPHYVYHKFDFSNPASHRRSIYRFVVRSQPNPWMTTLDCADSSLSTPVRTETLTSLQALTLLNSHFNLMVAERFAERLAAEEGKLSAQVDLAIQLTLQRTPSAEEREEWMAFAAAHGLNNLARFLFNLSEFVYVD